MKEKAYFHGCLRVDSVPEGLVPRRFTAYQLNHWDASGEVRMVRARSTAGITMRFTTDQEVLRFRYTVLTNCKDEITFDLWEGNCLTQAVTFPASGSGVVEFHRILGCDREVRIYLPYTAEVALSDFDFGNAHPIPESADAKRILWLGDSISQGMRAIHPSETLVSVLARRWNCEILNHGVGGCGFKDICSDFSADDWNPELLVILLGTNDTGVYREDSERYQNLLKTRLDEACAVFSAENIRRITPFWRAGLETDPALRCAFMAICDLIRKEAAARGIPLIEGYYANPRCADFYEDGHLHPNDSGFAAIAEVLEHQIL